MNLVVTTSVADLDDFGLFELVLDYDYLSLVQLNMIEEFVVIEVMLVLQASNFYHHY